MQTKKEIQLHADETLRQIILAIYFEFVFKQQDEAKWEAGMETMEQLGRAVKLLWSVRVRESARVPKKKERSRVPM